VIAWNNLSDTTIKVGQVLRLAPPDTQPSTANSSPAVVTAAPLAPNANPATNPAAVENGSQTAPAKNYPKALKLPYSEEAVRTLVQQSEGSSKAKPANSTAASAPVVQPDKKDSSTPAMSQPNKAKTEEAPAAATAEDGVAWIWPTQGKVIRGYSDSNKGVDISGRSGQAVLAAADGKVVYSGNGLRGYGKLIIIKHNKTFLSAYAHNSQLLVKEGQTVKKGQKIAEMGNTDADQVKLHFEIRRFGKPVDPMQYLENKS